MMGYCDLIVCRRKGRDLVSRNSVVSVVGRPYKLSWLIVVRFYCVAHVGSGLELKRWHCFCGVWQ